MNYTRWNQYTWSKTFDNALQLKPYLLKKSQTTQMKVFHTSYAHECVIVSHCIMYRKNGHQLNKVLYKISILLNNWKGFVSIDCMYNIFFIVLLKHWRLKTRCVVVIILLQNRYFRRICLTKCFCIWILQIKLTNMFEIVTNRYFNVGATADNHTVIVTVWYC